MTAKFSLVIVATTKLAEIDVQRKGGFRSRARPA